MQLMVECEDCKKKFAISSNQGPNSLTNKKKYEIGGQSIYLTYYDCPSCGRRHFVQIDNDASLKLLKEVSSQFVKLATKKKQGKEVPQKQSAKFNKTRKYLSNYRMNLMKEYVNKIVHDEETNSDFILRFSLC